MADRMTGRLRDVRPALAALALLAAGCGGGCSGGAGPADLVLRNGRVVTLDDSIPLATAVAIREGRIAWVGNEAGVEARIGPGTEVVELDGRLLLPGFIEAHAHFLGVGIAKLGLDLSGARSWEEVVARVAAAVPEAAPGAWIVGRGWHQSKWESAPRPSVRGFPVHDALSAVTPDNPVWLTHASGHAGLANARAMEAAGIGPDTPSPEGGEILRGADGRAIGVFVENAEALVDGAYAAWLAGLGERDREERLRTALRLANEEAVRHGITTVHDAGASPRTIEAYRRAIADGDVAVRLWVMLSEEHADPATLEAVRTVGGLDGHLTVRAIKAYADGALGSRGAWLLEPYEDASGAAGHNVTSMERIRELADLALEHDYQLCTHAIGDRAVREVLDAYEAALAAHPGEARDARFRIEHAQLIHPDDLGRFARLGVIAAMQGVHSVSDAPWTPDRIGESRTRERAFAFRDLVDSGALVLNGTDAPVEPIDPVASFAAMATGRLADGSVFNPHHLLTREEALLAYTRHAAYGGHEEGDRGSIAVGKRADLVVLTRDILAVPAEEIADARAALTVIGGRVVWGDAGAD
jgi:predicted amidohydrolase YtcJ